MLSSPSVAPVALQRSHKCDDFNCGSPALNEYLSRFAWPRQSIGARQTLPKQRQATPFFLATKNHKSHKPDDLLNRTSLVWTQPISVEMWFAYGLALLANSFAEEIVMRGYMIDRLEQLFGKSWLEILISSLLFGSYHIYQGLLGAGGAVFIGMVFGTWFVSMTAFATFLLAAPPLGT